MVRFADAAPDKSGYRTFGMKTVGAAAVAAGTATSKGAGRDVDDPASIGEAVLRRYRGLRERGEALPDLVLIDGGPTQLAAARAALREAGCPDLALCSLAKEEELVHLPGQLNPLRLKRNDPALQLLQRVRDEAHRFGIRQVRRKAQASVTASPLDAVPGIGPKRRAQLVKAFGGLEGLRAAGVGDLQRMPGVTKERAEAIVSALRANSV
jgi:excinuclease ABC subunit C